MEDFLWLNKEMKLKKKYTWDLSSFPTDEAFETELAQVSGELKNASNLAGHLLDSAESLFDNNGNSIKT